jgi:hypothetical protein
VKLPNATARAIVRDVLRANPDASLTYDGKSHPMVIAPGKRRVGLPNSPGRTTTYNWYAKKFRKAGYRL